MDVLTLVSLRRSIAPVGRSFCYYPGLNPALKLTRQVVCLSVKSAFTNKENKLQFKMQHDRTEL